MTYQIIDAVMAQAIQEDTVRTHPLFAWIVMRDVPKYPPAFVARLVADAPTSYAFARSHLRRITGPTAARPRMCGAPAGRSAGSRGGVVPGVGRRRSIDALNRKVRRR
jgi:hypothetical protein